MIPKVSELLKKALALPPKARAELAGLILDSLDDQPADKGVEAAWSKEIKRRIEEIDSGKVEIIPYEEARRQLRQLIREGKKSGPAKPWKVAEMKRAGRKRLSERRPSGGK